MPLPAEDHRISRPSMRDEVYQYLLDWIVEGVLEPGEKVVDKELADHMGVSRTPVREALRRLEDMHLVESSANRWTRISKIPDNEPEMIYPLIWTLERLALSLSAAHLTSDDFKQMKLFNSTLATALENRDPAAALKADNDFHSVFIGRCHNVLLVRFLRDLKIRSRRLEKSFFTRVPQRLSSIGEHDALLSALAAGDMDLAGKILEKNWKKSLEHFTSHAKKTPRF